MVECLTRDREAAGSNLTGVTALWSLSKTHLSSLELVQPRDTHPGLTERLLMGRKEPNRTNKTKMYFPKLQTRLFHIFLRKKSFNSQREIKKTIGLSKFHTNCYPNNLLLPVLMPTL